MVRFKVIRASRLLLLISVILLIGALALLGLRLLSGQGSAPESGSASLVSAKDNEEAKTTAMVFASSGHGAAHVSTPQKEAEGASIEIEILPQATVAPVTPRVLIYHTHTHEAYEQVSEDPYEALEAWRTNDADHSVVRVGEELAKLLRRYGFEAVHDVTDHEGDALSTAYTRSVVTLEGYEEPFDLYIDLHRDAYIQDEPRAISLSDGEMAAQLMMLIGNGNGFDEKPFYEQNLAFATALRDRINAIEPGLCKPVMVKDGRYNQHIGVFAILVEVGHNRNTLKEALNAMPALAEALDVLMARQPDAKLVDMQRAYRTHAIQNGAANQGK